MCGRDRSTHPKEACRVGVLKAEVVVFSVTRFCVQAFGRRGGLLRPTEVRECYFEEEARREMQVLARRSSGVALYRVRGEPLSGLWGKPRLIERQGEILALD
ncbi:hypothetical protein CSW62_07280 [Caulobacter sp. FWC2]|nr:hypothetical protein CSW62_07280 [Caulobacter sp. FWC2]